jgi:hypothetical protein
LDVPSEFLKLVEWTINLNKTIKNYTQHRIKIIAV